MTRLKRWGLTVGIYAIVAAATSLLAGGQERTEAEYDSLFAKGGFKLRRVIPTTSVVSIVEAVPA